MTSDFRTSDSESDIKSDAGADARTSIRVGDEAFVPFWIVLESLDATPPDPFIRCRVINLGRKRANSPAGPVEYMACDLDLGKPHLVAYSVPVTYLIRPADLEAWADRIADWFRNYPRTLS